MIPRNMLGKFVQLNIGLRFHLRQAHRGKIRQSRTAGINFAQYDYIFTSLRLFFLQKKFGQKDHKTSSVLDLMAHWLYDKESRAICLEHHPLIRCLTAHLVFWTMSWDADGVEDVCSSRDSIFLIFPIYPDPYWKSAVIICQRHSCTCRDLWSKNDGLQPTRFRGWCNVHESCASMYREGCVVSCQNDIKMAFSTSV